MKGIGLKAVAVTDEEYAYYLQLVKAYSDGTHSGEDYFVDLFDVDNQGNISIIKPAKNIPWAVVFFVQNLMINQHLRIYERIEALERKVNGRK